MRRNERGSAMILVMALLAIMTIYLVSNGVVLNQLRAELKQIEHRQQLKFAPRK